MPTVPAPRPLGRGSRRRSIIVEPHRPILGFGRAGAIATCSVFDPSVMQGTGAKRLERSPAISEAATSPLLKSCGRGESSEPCSDVTFPVNFRDMNVVSPSAVIRSAPERSFVHVNRLPGTAAAARQAASRAARSGEILPVRRGLYYRGAKTRYGMTRPRVEDVVREVLGEAGTGPAGYSAAREWGVTTQVPSSFHVATLWTADPIAGVTQHTRRNKERASLNAKEIALLELLRAPDVFVEAGWEVLVRRVHDALAKEDVRVGALRAAVARERNTAVRENFDRLVADSAAR